MGGVFADAPHVLQDRLQCAVVCDPFPEEFRFLRTESAGDSLAAGLGGPLVMGRAGKQSLPDSWPAHSLMVSSALSSSAAGATGVMGPVARAAGGVSKEALSCWPKEVRKPRWPS